MRMEVPAKEYPKNIALINTVLGRGLTNLETPDTGDFLKVDYTLYIDYCHDVATRLGAIIKLREAGVPISIDMKELTRGCCVFAEVVKHMDTLLEPK